MEAMSSLTIYDHAGKLICTVLQEHGQRPRISNGRGSEDGLSEVGMKLKALITQPQYLLMSRQSNTGQMLFGRKVEPGDADFLKSLEQAINIRIVCGESVIARFDPESEGNREADQSNDSNESLAQSSTSSDFECRL